MLRDQWRPLRSFLPGWLQHRAEPSAIPLAATGRAVECSSPGDAAVRSPLPPAFSAPRGARLCAHTVESQCSVNESPKKSTTYAADLTARVISSARSRACIPFCGIGPGRVSCANRPKCRGSEAQAGPSQVHAASAAASATPEVRHIKSASAVAAVWSRGRRFKPPFEPTFPILRGTVRPGDLGQAHLRAHIRMSQGEWHSAIQ